MKIKVSNGNKKIGKDTLIINITSAKNCPSKKLGLCKHADKCYAMKAEKQYPSVLPYRREQTVIWDNTRVNDIVSQIRGIAKRTRKHKIRYIRFSESGDFRNQQDVDKMSAIAKHLSQDGIKVYGYTARKDLDYSKAFMVINGSGFMVHNKFTATDTPKGLQCIGNCRKCNLCKTKGKKSIMVRYH